MPPKPLPGMLHVRRVEDYSMISEPACVFTQPGPNTVVPATIGASQKLPFVDLPAATSRDDKRPLLRLSLPEVLSEAHEIPIRVLNKELPLTALYRTCSIPNLARLLEQGPLRSVERSQDRV